MIRTRRIFFIGIDDVWFDKPGFINSKKSISILHTQLEIERKKYSVRVIEKTFLIDLRHPIDKIFNAFEPKSARYPIRKAERDGIIVKKATTEKDRQDFISFFKQFSEQKKIPNIKEDDLQWQDIFCAYSPGGEFIGGASFIKANDKTVYRYKHGATNYTGNANDLLLWHAIQHSKEAGFVFFDLGGVRVNQNKNSYYYRHYKFKEKFGGVISDFYTYIKIKKPLSYFMIFPDLFVKLFFKDDYTSFINFLSRIKIMR